MILLPNYLTYFQKHIWTILNMRYSALKPTLITKILLVLFSDTIVLFGIQDSSENSDLQDTSLFILWCYCFIWYSGQLSNSNLHDTSLFTRRFQNFRHTRFGIWNIAKLFFATNNDDNLVIFFFWPFSLFSPFWLALVTQLIALSLDHTVKSFTSSDFYHSICILYW